MRLTATLLLTYLASALELEAQLETKLEISVEWGNAVPCDDEELAFSLESQNLRSDFLTFADALKDVVSAGIKQKLAEYNAKTAAERCCMPLASRQSDTSAADFLGTSGRSPFKYRLPTMYEGEVDCVSKLPSGIGRLYVIDED